MSLLVLCHPCHLNQTKCAANPPSLHQLFQTLSTYFFVFIFTTNFTCTFLVRYFNCYFCNFSFYELYQS